MHKYSDGRYTILINVLRTSFKIIDENHDDPYRTIWDLDYGQVVGHLRRMKINREL